MSEALITHIIGSVTTIIVALITLLKIRKMGKDVNGHMTNLLNLTEAKGEAKGKREGKAEEKKEQGAK